MVKDVVVPFFSPQEKLCTCGEFLLKSHRQSEQRHYYLHKYHNSLLRRSQVILQVRIFYLCKLFINPIEAFAQRNSLSK